MSDIIVESELILDIRTLVDQYGDILEGLRLVKRSLYQFEKYMETLEEQLMQYYKG